MTRKGDDAINYARGRVGQQMPQSGYCLAFTRECFAVPSYYASAIDAAQASQYPHAGDQNPPPAVPVYFRSASVYDHVAFFISQSEVITTWNADIRKMSFAQMKSSYGPYMGWAEDINRVYVMETAPPKPPIPEDLMAEKRAVLHNIQANTWLFIDLDAYTTQQLDPDRARLMAGVHDVKIQDWNAGDITYLLDAITAQRKVNKA